MKVKYNVNIEKKVTKNNKSIFFVVLIRFVRRQQLSHVSTSACLLSSDNKDQ